MTSGYNLRPRPRTNHHTPAEAAFGGINALRQTQTSTASAQPRTTTAKTREPKRSLATELRPSRKRRRQPSVEERASKRRRRCDDLYKQIEELQREVEAMRARTGRADTDIKDLKTGARNTCRVFGTVFAAMADMIEILPTFLNANVEGRPDVARVMVDENRTLERYVYSHFISSSTFMSHILTVSTLALKNCYKRAFMPSVEHSHQLEY
jgi:hypothetical protein